jgi:hypothetical protein
VCSSKPSSGASSSYSSSSSSSTSTNIQIEKFLLKLKIEPASSIIKFLPEILFFFRFD